MNISQLKLRSEKFDDDDDDDNNNNNNKMMIMMKKCRRYQLLNETKGHLISMCLIVAKGQNRHDRIYAQVHFDICKEIVVKLENEHS